MAPASRSRTTATTSKSTEAIAATALPSSLETLSSSIPPHFSQSQSTLVNHRKNHASLFRIHLNASTHTQQTPKGTKLIGEKAFNDVFLGCVNRVLDVKKGSNEADRAIKFVGGYVNYCHQQFSLQSKKSKSSSTPVSDESSDEDGVSADSTATRFTTILIKHFLRGFGSKNKNVRLRCSQGIAVCLNGLESMDDDLYQLLLTSLIERSQDKESTVRVQAIIALSKLQGGDALEEEEDDEDDEDEDGSERNGQKVLRDILRYDPSSEARRASLFNLTPAPSTLPIILERLRDVDPINRRCVYLGSLTQVQTNSNVLYKEHVSKEELGEFDPMKWGLTFDQTEMITKIGLGERDESVKKACEKLLAGWFDGAGGNVEVFLARFNPLLSPDSSSTILSALSSLLHSRPQLSDSIQRIISSQTFWTELTPLKSLLIKSLTDYCRKNSSESVLEEILPPVTGLAFRIQGEWNGFSKAVHSLQLLSEDEQEEELEEESEDEDEDSEKETQSQEKRNQVSNLKVIIKQKEFILKQLLSLAMNLDYGDEIGRRKMFGLVRDILDCSISPTENGVPEIEDDQVPRSESGLGSSSSSKSKQPKEDSFPNVTPESLVPFCLDVLLRLSAGQRDFMRVVVELVQGDKFADEVEEDQTRDDDEDEDEVDAELSGRQSPKKKKGLGVHERNLLAEERKLEIVKGMLERVGGALQENTFLHGLIPDLIAPAVRSKEASIRELGIINLGLCCLLDSSLALDTMPLILDQISRATGPIKLRSTEILFDLMSIHGLPFLCGAPSHPGKNSNLLTKEEVDQMLKMMKDAKVKQTRLVRGLLGLMEDDDEKLQASAAEGIAKLMLAGALGSPSPIVEKKKKGAKNSKPSETENGEEGDETINPDSKEDDEEDEEEGEEEQSQPQDDEDAALYSLVLVYMSPETIGNQQLRQCLSYFLPAYCGSGKGNARRLQRVFLRILVILSSVYHDKDPSQEMVTPLQVGLQLVEWTDPNKVVNESEADWSIHLDLAIDLVKALFKSEEKEERKVFCQLLSKLSLPEPEEIEDRKPEILLYLLSQLSDVNPLSDTVSRNALQRFETSFSKRYPEAATAAKELDLSALPTETETEPEELSDLKSFLHKLDLAPPKVEKSRPKPKAAVKSKKASASSRGRSKKKAGGRRKKGDSDSEEESEDDDDDDGASQTGTETETDAATDKDQDEDELSETEEDFDA